MKNIYKIFTIIALFGSSIFLNSCKEADPITYSGPALVSFSATTSGAYFVQETGDPGFEIQVGFTTASGSDRVVNFTVSGDAADGEQYTLASSSITVPANSYIGTLKVNGIYAGFTGQVDTLIVTLTGDDVANFDNTFTLVMQRYCPFAIDDFIGDWTAYEVSDYDGAYAPYSLTFASDGDNSLVTSDIWPYFPVVFTFDATDPANFICNIPDQFLADDLYGYGEARIVDLGGGSFSSCDGTITIRYKVYVSAGNFEQSTLTLVKN